MRSILVHSSFHTNYSEQLRWARSLTDSLVEIPVSSGDSMAVDVAAMYNREAKQVGLGKHVVGDFPQTAIGKAGEEGQGQLESETE
jgi:hypothetical protein